MRKLQKPTDNPVDVFDTCISIVKNKALKKRLTSIKPKIKAAGRKYEAAASSVKLHAFPKQNKVGGVSTAEMSKIYKFRMAQQGTPGRFIYDKLRAIPQYGLCPLCGQRVVSTLDHYLPQSRYPALVVMPMNLVPACSDCNRIKHELIPTTRKELTLHPYYDDVENDLWLHAEVIEDSPAAIRFFVNPPRGWDRIKAARVKNHFKVFKLESLYAANAASELVDIRDLLANLFSSAGAEGVKDHLQDYASSCSRAHINSWKTAMFRALANNDWFCAGGFR